jgi:ABC-type transporter lipoprotein component MlaA
MIAGIKQPLFIALGCLLFEFASAKPLANTESNSPPQTAVESPGANSIILPSGFNDPIEPFNRAMWGFNKGVMTSVVRPFSRGYRHVVVKPVRTGIGNMGKNMTYPGRLVNNVLQGNWAGMGDETGRCLCNTVFGLGGFFDVATRWGVPKSDAHFGQTFKNGVGSPGFYLMLPIFGPSDDRDGVGSSETRRQPDVLFLSLRLHWSWGYGQ